MFALMVTGASRYENPETSQSEREERTVMSIYLGEKRAPSTLRWLQQSE